MKPVFLHIGLPKTGTTALQNWLERYAPQLLERGLFCFDQTNFAHRLALEAVLDTARKGEADALAIAAYSLDRARDDLRRALDDPAIARIFISSEYFSISDPSTVRRMLSAIGIEDVTIIVTLRRQDRFIESAYSQQVLLMGRTAAIAAPHFAPWYDWHLLVSSWAQAFDRRIEVLPYERLAAKGKSINSEIVRLVDASAAEIGKDVLDAKVNVGVPAKLLEFKRLANHSGDLALTAFVDNAIAAGIDMTRFRMKSRKAKRYMSLYRRSNRAVARQFLESKGDLFDESDLERERRNADFTDRLSVQDIVGLVARYMSENPGRADGRIGELSTLAQEQTRQIVEADQVVRRLLRDLEDRDRKLVDADGSIRMLLSRVEEGDRRLVEADGSIRMLLGQVEDRNRQLVAADAAIRMLQQQVEERDRRLAEAEAVMPPLLGGDEEGEGALPQVDAAFREQPTRLVGEHDEPR